MINVRVCTVSLPRFKLNGRLERSTDDQVTHLQIRAKARSLQLHSLDQLGALDPFRPAGKILDQGGDGELAPWLVAFQHQRFQVGAGGIDGGREAGAAGAEDNGFANIF